MSIIINDISDYSKLYELLNDTIVDERCVRIKITLGFINPHDVLIISQFAILIKRLKPNIVLDCIESSQKLTQYLRDIGLMNFLKGNYIQPKTIKFIDKQTAMPIRRVEQSSIEEYVVETLRYIGNICIGKDLSVLSVGIKESINNVYDHSNSIIGAYVFCQYYPKKRTIRICVADSGVGIPAVVRKSKPGLSDDECLKWALIGKNTTQSLPSNAGMGLTIIKDFTVATRGKLMIVSGSSNYSLVDGKEKYSKNNIKHFKGTLIEMDIKVDELEDDIESFASF